MFYGHSWQRREGSPSSLVKYLQCWIDAGARYIGKGSVLHAVMLNVLRTSIISCVHVQEVAVGQDLVT